MAAGLEAASGLNPGRGYFEALAGVRGEGPAWAAYVRSELGWKFAPSGAVFVHSEASKTLAGPVSWMAGVGARLRW